MKVYRKHYWCDDGSSARMVNYDCGVAFILSMQGFEIGEMLDQIHYVGILKYI